MPLIRLQQQRWRGLLLDPFGKSVRVVEFDGNSLRITRKNQVTSISLQSLTGPPIVRKEVIGASVLITSNERNDVRLKGVRHFEAREFSERLNAAWIRLNLATLEKSTPRLEDIVASIRALALPSRFPAACAISPLLDDARALYTSLLHKLDSAEVEPEVRQRIAIVREFTLNAKSARTSGAAAFVTAELERWKALFDTIESNPLTYEQRLSVVTDEDATLVLAGAGSGKTSVITAKATYLVQAGIRQPDEILLLAFARDAAAEMSERIATHSGIPIVARTFHAIAYHIIGVVEGSKPALVDHAADDLAFVNLIKQILKDLVHTFSSVSTAVIRWFSRFLVEPKSEWDFKTKHDFYSYLERQDLRTLQGEKVKSYEELRIANWLYENGIEYQYETDYPHKAAGEGRRDYQPDFHLTESDIYIEHFGVRRQKFADGGERLFTAPFVNCEEYLAGMKWKRRIHAENKTILIETYSYERQEGSLLTGLAEKLAPYVTLKPRPADAIYDRIVALKQVDDFSKLLGTFLRKFKSGSYSLADCHARSEHLNLGKRAKAFLEVFAAVFDEYQKRLGGRIDFEDMMLRAAQYVENGRYISPFRHILIDEFQDISQSRARLLKALKSQDPDVRIFAVGDDWQSIFRFSGSELHLMRDFGQEFGGVFDDENDVYTTIDLRRTFRSVDQIAFAARRFVLQNPAQIDKEIVPAMTSADSAIKILNVPQGEKERKLFEALSGLVPNSKADSKPPSVLLLGRYRALAPDVAHLRRQFPGLRIDFKTIHSAKGLEADHVILLHANGGRTGFPSEIVDDVLLSLVSPEEESFPNAEERRVMYVAMTRARRTLMILASNVQPSVFVTELRDNPAYGIAAAPGPERKKHFCGACGGRLLQVSGRNHRNWFRCEHIEHCGNLLPVCPSCETDLPRRAERSQELRCGCGARYPACPECEDGWLTERNGSYGRFLGCIRYPACVGKAKFPVREPLTNTSRTNR